MSQEDAEELELLLYTPSSALGSCRYKMADPDVDDTDYKRILEIFKKYDVRYFFYNGGNDSMDTCNKISKYMQKVGYECRVMGVPKTIDNDLFGTDHCPGYASAAKYIATSCTVSYTHLDVYKRQGLNSREYSAHKLRHTAATLMLQNGVDVKAVQEVLGHEHLNTTEIYTHIDNDALRVAARANPLGRVKRSERKKKDE